MKTYRNPIPTVDIIIEVNGRIILINRKNPPYEWAIPGGYVDYGKSLEEAAIREAEEETSLKVISLIQLHTYSDPDRDPRNTLYQRYSLQRGMVNPKPEMMPGI